MPDRFDLAGQVAIITGGAGVLGLVFAHALAEHGAHIILADLGADRCHAAADRIAGDHGVSALGIVADVSQPEDVARLAGRAEAEFGRIDILVNNAAAQPPGFTSAFEDYPLQVWNEVMAVNVTGMFLCAQAVGKVMLTQKRGSIINISSIYGVVAPDQRIYQGAGFSTPAVYSVSKAGVLGLTRYLAAYWADQGIRVNAITPGGVFREQPEDFLSLYSARAPLGRMAREEELAGAVVYLASGAASYVTGHNLVVDGGWTVW